MLNATNQVKISIHPDYEPDSVSLFNRQVEMVRTLAAANGVHIRRHSGDKASQEMVFDVFTDNGASTLIDAFERFDDTVPSPHAYFHMWALTDVTTGRTVQMPVKIDRSWD